MMTRIFTFFILLLSISSFGQSSLVEIDTTKNWEIEEYALFAKYINALDSTELYKAPNLKDAASAIYFKKFVDTTNFDFLSAPKLKVEDKLQFVFMYYPSIMSGTRPYYGGSFLIEPLEVTTLILFFSNHMAQAFKESKGSGPNGESIVKEFIDKGSVTMILSGCLGGANSSVVSEETLLHYLKIWKYSYGSLYLNFTNKGQKRELDKSLKDLKKRYKKNPEIQEALKTYHSS